MVICVAGRIELGGREAIAAVLFMILVLVLVALAQAGFFSPVVIGAVITVTVLLVFVGYGLVKYGVISREALPLWYFFTIGLILVFYGAILRGVMPLIISSNTLEEAGLISSLIYVSILTGIIAVIAILYVLARRRIIPLRL